MCIFQFNKILTVDFYNKVILYENDSPQFCNLYINNCWHPTLSDEFNETSPSIAEP